MPFIIAGILYALLLGAALVVVFGICLVRRQPPGGYTFGGAVGSFAGFLLGCVTGGLVCFALPVVGLRVGATVVIVAASLIAALIGMVVGANAWGVRQK